MGLAFCGAGRGGSNRLEMCERAAFLAWRVLKSAITNCSEFPEFEKITHDSFGRLLRSRRLSQLGFSSVARALLQVVTDFALNPRIEVRKCTEIMSVSHPSSCSWRWHRPSWSKAATLGVKTNWRCTPWVLTMDGKSSSVRFALQLDNITT